MDKIDVRQDAERVLRHLHAEIRFSGEKDSFIKSMKELPVIKNDRFYRSYPEYANIILQADVISDLPVVALPDTTITNAAAALVFSSSCDIDVRNDRMHSPALLYSPIISTKQYEKSLHAELNANNDSEKASEISRRLKDVREQKITQLFYLPPGPGMNEEMLVSFDAIQNIDNESIDRNTINTRKLLSLSSYGWYIFLFRLSVFFNRMSDEVVQLRSEPHVS